MYSVLLSRHDELGEGPVYDSRLKRLYWVDINGMRINFMGLQSKAVSSIRAPGRVSSLGLTDDMDVIVASVELGMYSVSTSSGSFRLLGSVDERGTRFNDGKPDPFGDYVVGTMDLDEREPLGSLYLFDGRSFRTLVSSLTISNGLAWDAERRAFYHIDSPRRVVMEYRYDDEMRLSEPHVALDLRDEPGVPDGMTIDSEGALWIAKWGGSAVSRWDPALGEKLGEVKLPARNISCPAFGGPGLKTLFITSAKGEADDLGGSLFAAEVDASGVEPFRFLAHKNAVVK